MTIKKYRCIPYTYQFLTVYSGRILVYHSYRDRIFVHIRWSLFRSRHVDRFFYEGNLNGDRYWELINEILNNIWDDLDLMSWYNMNFLHSGTLTHKYFLSIQILQHSEVILFDVILREYIKIAGKDNWTKSLHGLISF